MFSYIVRRLLLVIPTLFLIMLVNFAIINAAPGGPLESLFAKFQGFDITGTSSLSGGAHEGAAQQSVNSMAQGSVASKYRGARGLPEDYVKKLEKQFGYDKPPVERFFIMLKNYIAFDFGESYFRGRPVVDLIKERLPVSITLGFWTFLITYLVCIPLGIAKAVRDGSKFDTWTSGIIIVGYAIPSFLFAIFLIVLFAGGTYFDLFPLRGLSSENWEQFSTFHKITDYMWHITLPVTALVIGNFASLTMLTKNSFLEEINKQYVLTAKAKGLTKNAVLYKHIFRNAMLIIIAGLPAAVINILFTGALIIEIVFSLDGLGLLGYEAVIQRDYAIVFATLYIFTLLSIVMKIVNDITYHLVDPRIDFDTREA